MIPTGDNLQRRSVPFMNYFFIIINIMVFVLELTPNGADLVHRFGAVPRLITQPFQHPFALITLVTAMFLHGGWMHLIGNMIYLGVFGDNIEDTLGHFRYIGFYLLGGIIASLTHIFLEPSSQVPMVGASGAIAAVLGAYLVFFYRAKVRVAIVIFFYIHVTWVSSLVILGFWFILQLFSGLGSVSATSGAGGVAYWAHVGGFIAGLIMAAWYRIRQRRLVKGQRRYFYPN